jgi:hypothetical protein
MLFLPRRAFSALDELIHVLLSSSAFGRRAHYEKKGTSITLVAGLISQPTCKHRRLEKFILQASCAFLRGSQMTVLPATLRAVVFFERYMVIYS